MRSHRLAPIIAAALLAAGCTPSADEPESEPTTAEATESSPSSAPSESESESTWDVAPSEEAPLAHGDEGPAAAKDGDVQDAAKEANATMKAFFDTKDPKKWWKKLSKHLTPAAQDVWKYTDPGRVPDGKVHGKVEAGEVSATDAEMTVPTTQGDYQLVLVRDGAKDPWRVSAITPPEEEGQG